MLRLQAKLILVLLAAPAMAAGPVTNGVVSSSRATSDSSHPDFVTNLSGDSIPRQAVVWHLFMQLTMPAYQVVRGPLTTALGLDQANTDRLIAYAKASIAEDQRYERDTLRGICSDITTDITAHALASKLETLEQATDHWREARVAALSTLLDAKANESLERWIARQRMSMGTSKVDYYKMLEQPGAREVILEGTMQGCKQTAAGTGAAVAGASPAGTP